MALQIPQDVPSNPFTWAGMLALDGRLFDNTRKVDTNVLTAEVEYVRTNIIRKGEYRQSEWQQIRNVVLLWCFSHRRKLDNMILNTLFSHVGLEELRLPTTKPSRILEVIGAKHNRNVLDRDSPIDWIRAIPPPQRFSVTASATTVAEMSAAGSIAAPMSRNYHRSSNTASQPLHQSPQLHAAILPTGHRNGSIMSPNSSLPTPSSNSNPKFDGRYRFTEHRQEYEGYQFQCIFRCLRDKRHCRKAPVREMNRHLRDRHRFRPGFKIAGVDWDHKRWRGAGAGHGEYMGRIVAKDAPDDDSGEEDDDDDDGG